MNDDIVILLRNKKEKGKIKDFYKFKNDLKELYLFDYILCSYQIKTDKFIYIDLPTNIFFNRTSYRNQTPIYLSYANNQS